MCALPDVPGFSESGCSRIRPHRTNRAERVKARAEAKEKGTERIRSMLTDTEGIILRQTKAAGGRRMILLFSRKYGKISVGTGLNEKSRGKSALAMRPFTYGRYELFKNRDSYNLNSAEVLKSYYKIGEDVDKYMNSAYVLEFTEKLLAEEQPAAGLFRLILDFFDAMEIRKKKHETLVLAYQIKAMKIMGIMPQLNQCVRCGADLSRDKPQGQEANCGPAYFSIADGGVICRTCGDSPEISRNDRLIYSVDFGIVDILKYFSGNPLKSFENLALKEDVQKQLHTMMKEYAAYYLDIGELKSERFLEEY